MSKKRFALEPDGPERLEISWESGWFLVAANVRVKLDGKEIAVFPSPDELRTEQIVSLPDGTNLSLRLKGSTNFVVRQNGTDVSTLFHPKRRMRDLSHTLIVWGGVALIWFIWELTLKASFFSIVGLVLSISMIVMGLRLPGQMRQLFFPSMALFGSTFIMFVITDFMDTSKIFTVVIISVAILWIISFQAGLKIIRTISPLENL